MDAIETRTTHTAVLEWPYKAALSKDELIYKLKISIPDTAQIVGMTVSDVLRRGAGQSFPKVMRSLTITYLDNSPRRYGRP